MSVRFDELTHHNDSDDCPVCGAQEIVARGAFAQNATFVVDNNTNATLFVKVYVENADSPSADIEVPPLTSHTLSESFPTGIVIFQVSAPNYSPKRI